MNITKTLGFMGLIPFVASFIISIQNTTWQIDAKQVFIAYSAIILSFMAGTLWRATTQEVNAKQKLISNIFSLLAFLSLLIPPLIAIAILASSYLTLFLYESTAANNKLKSNNTSYMKMRLQLTLVVVSLHIAAFIFWLS